jgi:hypothetical protein
MPAFPGSSFESLPQFAVLWAATGTDKYGQPTVADPVQIPIWVKQEMTRLAAPNHGGDTSAESADVLLIVDQKIPVGSRMWLGKLSEWYSAAPGAVKDRTLYVKFYKRVYDPKADMVTQSVGLMKHMDAQGV